MEVDEEVPSALTMKAGSVTMRSSMRSPQDLASFSCRIGEVTAAWQLLAPTSAAAAASSSPEFDSMSTF